MRYYMVDAFSDKPFHGNQAGVCPPQEPLEPSLMQCIAMENNLSETAFAIKRRDAMYDLRWFTPAVEIELCGHATLATAFVLFSTDEKDAQQLTFDTASGVLKVSREGDLLLMDFPVRSQTPVEITDSIRKAVDQNILEAHGGYNLQLLLESEDAVRTCVPDIRAIRALDYHGVIVTAKGEADADFVSRFFAPNVGIVEDPVTGSTHTSLTPFWAERLGKTSMKARQLSARGGDLIVRLGDNRVLIGGKACFYMVGGIIYKAQE